MGRPARVVLDTFGRETRGEMPVDIAYLESLRSFRDPRGSFTETFLTPEIGGGRTVAVLTMPLLREPERIGWVFCHSFAEEQSSMQAIEVSMARSLGAAGFPVLRFHSQGYGDSELEPAEAGVRAHFQGATDALVVLRDLTSVPDVGLFGGRFGAAVAASVGTSAEAAALILWDPVVSGRRYAEKLVRRSIMSTVTSARATSDPIEELRQHASADLRGFPFRASDFDEMCGLDVAERLAGFQGQSLIVQLSRGSAVQPDIGRLMTALRRDASQLVIVTQDPDERPLGEPRYNERAKGTKADTQAGLERELVARTEAWVERFRSMPSSSVPQAMRGRDGT
jgi:pimeloyl-ACP methyl ester carboxylesterase